MLDATGTPVVIEVKTGLTDGNQTELTEGEVDEGRELIVGMSASTEKSKPLAQPRMF